MTPTAPDSQLLHANALAILGQGLLILGASGTGKSSLSLELMAHGGQLIADDQVRLSLRDSTLWAAAPDALRGRIEARGLGILSADTRPTARITLAIDLDQTERSRLPDRHHVSFLGVTLPCLHTTGSPHFTAALLQYLKGGRVA